MSILFCGARRGKMDSVFMPGAKVAFEYREQKHEGTVCDPGNLDPPPGRHISGMLVGWLIVLPDDKGLKKAGCYTPYWVIPADSAKPIIGASVATSIDLRSANTRLGATACAKCGGPLKNPMAGLTSFQHCPVCEP